MLVPPNEFEQQEYFYDDVHSTLTKISPYLIKMLMDLVHKDEQEVQIAALRGLEFLLVKLGCTLDSYMIDILQSIVDIYPSKKPSEAASEPMSHSPSENLPSIASKSPGKAKNPKSQDFSSGRDSNIVTASEVKSPSELSSKSLKNLIKVILDRFVSVLSSISSNILHQIFFDLLVKTLSEGKSPNELKILLIKIAEKIISICQGDLVLNKRCLESLLTFASLQNIESLGQAGASLWQSIRTKIM